MAALTPQYPDPDQSLHNWVSRFVAGMTDRDRQVVDDPHLTVRRALL
jgi:hypothetical protein